MTIRTNLWNVSLATVALAAVVAFPHTGYAGSTKNLATLAAESASTPEQHLALAEYYKDKAAEAQAEVKLHEGMALSYSSRSPGAAAGMANHCNSLAKSAKAEAADYEAMAAFHEAEAKK